MKTVLLFLSIHFFNPLISFSQKEPADSSKTLGEIILKAYEQNRQLKQVATAINYISPQELERFNNSSILPALNSTPGIRMEERSPGSYRMNIRGSTVRSPFGVRNVKIYWNEIPLTDPGGNTYLNQLSYYNFNSLEIIKGPAGSLYGAGTGGAILITSIPPIWKNEVDLRCLHGSFGLNNFDAQWKTGNDKLKNTFDYSHQISNGYRDHTSMHRYTASWQMQYNANKKEQFNFNLLYGDLYYQTPGALTKSEYNNNPEASRPAAGGLPSAATAQAAIFQKTFLAGFNNHYSFSERFENTSVLYGAVTHLTNPTFRNYEKRREPHVGARTIFNWKPVTKNDFLQIVFGAETQQGNFNTKDYRNIGGNPDTLQLNDDIRNSIVLFFAQADMRLANDWNITAGMSSTESIVRITRHKPSLPPQKRNYNNEWAPRIAVSKKIISNLWLYASISKGFSPPTTAEVLPSTGVISTNLNAEHGVNYEAGFKSSWLHQRLYVEVNAFSYQLKNAIVQRRDVNNADYFANAGSTQQKGIESQASFRVLKKNSGFVSHLKIWISHSWYDFRYKDFKQITTDYSGKRIPSIAPHTIATGADINLKHGFYSNITYYYSDKIALNDANSDFATSYNLLGARVGWKKNLTGKFSLEIFGGGDNLMNKTYSLGNDINAAGGRYYNAAPAVNYYIGVAFQFF